MQLQSLPLTVELISFVDRVYKQNRAVLHGDIIPTDEWYSAFGDGADPYEVNFIITADNQPAAWLKINGLNSEMPAISTLVVEDFFKRCGVGSFAIHFAEEYIKRLGKSSLLIFTT